MCAFFTCQVFLFMLQSVSPLNFLLRSGRAGFCAEKHEHRRKNNETDNGQAFYGIDKPLSRRGADE
jgi:hypothetical protein